MKSRPVPSPFAGLVEQLRVEAETLARVGALVSGAQAYRDVAQRLEQAWDTWWTEQLSVRDAAVECGYSEDRLRELAREGALRHTRHGRELRVRRCDLPRHAAAPERPAVEALAKRVLQVRS